jgi:hypothetical protein
MKKIRKLFFFSMMIPLYVLSVGCTYSNDEMKKMVAEKTGGKVFQHERFNNWDYFFSCKGEAVIVTQFDNDRFLGGFRRSIILDPNEVTCARK